MFLQCSSDSVNESAHPPLHFASGRVLSLVCGCPSLNLYNALTVVPPETILATSPELRTLQPVASAPQIKVDTKQFDTVVKTLNTLAKQPGFSDRVSFLVKYGSAVSAAYKSSMDKAAMQAKDTQGKAQSPAANPNKQP